LAVQLGVAAATGTAPTDPAGRSVQASRRIHRFTLQAAAAELAKKLQNPVASLISVPIQNNWDFGLGDTGQSFFFSPTAPTSSGWIWAAGPDWGLRFAVTFLFPK